MFVTWLVQLISLFFSFYIMHIPFFFQGTNNIKAIVLDQKENFSKCRADGFSNMRNLGLLILYHTNFSGNFNFLSNNLRYLSWYGYPFTGATNLQYLDSTSLFTIHESIGALAKLKFLSFRNCINLVEIPNSVKSITSLVTLDFYGCLKLTTLPLQWTYSSHMRSLIFLDLNFCNLHEDRMVLQR